MKTLWSSLGLGGSWFPVRPLARTSWAFRLVLAASLLAPAAAWAYPPNPYHLIFGTVRDEYGTPIQNAQAQVYLVATSGSQSKTFIQPNLAIGVNYQLPVPMDSLLKPDLYRSNALAAGAAFKMYVVIGNTTNVPIVSTSTVTNLGRPMEMTRIDLFLGVDSNGDGIPDAWELAFLAALGSNLALGDLNAGMDLAHNGRTLMQEYLRGPYAFDVERPLTVQMLEFNGGAPLLEFPVSAGASYSVLGSTNLEEWTVLPFRLPSEGSSGATRTNFTASASQALQVQVVAPDSEPKAQFFRIQQP